MSKTWNCLDSAYSHLGYNDNDNRRNGGEVEVIRKKWEIKNYGKHGGIRKMEKNGGNRKKLEKTGK